MKVLAIDTTLAACAAAIRVDGETRTLCSEPMTRGHAERLAPMARDVMAEAGLAFSQLDRVVVTTGPGSFTGVRVGLAFARGLAVALRIPCIGVSTLEALALEAGAAGLRGAAIPAAGGLYAAVYRNGRPVRPPAFTPDAECAGLQALDATWRGPAAGLFGGVETGAPDIAALAAFGETLDPTLYPPDPTYLRAPDAKLPAARLAAVEPIRT